MKKILCVLGILLGAILVFIGGMVLLPALGVFLIAGGGIMWMYDTFFGDF